MQKVESLGDIELEVLPSKVVRIMSKFSHKLRKYNGMIIRLSSKTILKELEHIHAAIDEPELNAIYAEVEDALSQYLLVPVKIPTDIIRQNDNKIDTDLLKKREAINSSSPKRYYRGIEIE